MMDWLVLSFTIARCERNWLHDLTVSTIIGAVLLIGAMALITKLEAIEKKP